MGLLKKLFGSKPEQIVEEPVPTITVELLEEHLNSIKVRLAEIAGYKKKKVVKTPTHIYWKAIDLEEAWPSSREMVDHILLSMEGVATTFHVDPGEIPPNSSFRDALTHIDILAQRIMFQLEDTDEVTHFSQEKLAAVDQQILTIQDTVNQLQHYVVREFDFTAVLSGDASAQQG